MLRRYFISDSPSGYMKISYNCDPNGEMWALITRWKKEGWVEVGWWTYFKKKWFGVGRAKLPDCPD